LILGAVFIYASLDKIIHPLAFAKAVHRYQILPDPLINITAIVLPYLELLLGLLLVLGIWLPASALLVNLLLAVFLGAIVFNVARGLDIDCGCFSTGTESFTAGCMCLDVIRDGVFLTIGILLLYGLYSRKQEPLTIG
jgi:uncharacterized membrane protein YphA (DoxX/SURF4 family)